MEGPGSTPPAIPEAISFRELRVLLEQASEQGSAGTADTEAAGATSAAPLDQLERLLETYASLSRNVLEQLDRHGERLKADRSGQQLMALGALGAHIRMGLHALAASRA